MKKINCKRKTFLSIIIKTIIAYCLLSILSVFIFNFFFYKRNDEFDFSYDITQYSPIEVQFLSGENQLTGFIYGQDNSNGIIVFAHGIFANADAHLEEILFFVQNNWVVFTFDSTGTRYSQGNTKIGLEQMKYDVLNAIDYLKDNYPDIPICLYGHSLGGYSVASALNESPEVKAVISINGFNDPSNTMVSLASQYVGFFAKLQQPFLYFVNCLTYGKTANQTAVDGINNVSIPILIIKGSDDVIINEDISIYNKKEQITNTNVQFLFIDDAYRNQHSSYPYTIEDAKKYLETDYKDFLLELDLDFMNYLNEFLIDSIQ